MAPTAIDLAALARRLASRRSELLGVHVPETLCVLADPDRIAQALDNLIENACAVAGRVGIEAECVAESVLLHVCDDGPGIPPEIRARLFEPFVSRRPGGTGLGDRRADRDGEPWQCDDHRPAGLVDLFHPQPAARPVSAGGILLVDDEPAFQRLGGAWLRGLGHTVTVAGSAAEAQARYADSQPDLVLLDLSMPPQMDPLAGIALIAGFLPTPVVVLTGHASHEIALKATEAGAWDFIAKPIDPDMLRFVVDRALRKAALDRELRTLRDRVAADDLGLLGRSEAVVRLRAMVRRLGPSMISVLVLGPTGTGKELVARALHACSPRAAGPFLPIHCGALPANLLESEFFGHLKGSFTGATRDQPGLIETAHRGTLLLDEVGEMPLPMQVKLLRFLQEGTFMPVGGRAAKRADVRVVAATHRDLEAMVLRTSALAERPDDITLLANVFLRRADAMAVLPPGAAEWLRKRSWPGNVRELRAMIEAAAALAGPGREPIDAGLLRFAAGDLDDLPTPTPSAASTLAHAIEEIERRMLSEALAASGGNQSEAARVLGLSRVGLTKKLSRLGLRSIAGADIPTEGVDLTKHRS